MKDRLQLTCYFIECAVSWPCLLSISRSSSQFSGQSIIELESTSRRPGEHRSAPCGECLGGALNDVRATLMRPAPLAVTFWVKEPCSGLPVRHQPEKPEPNSHPPLRCMRFDCYFKVVVVVNGLAFVGEGAAGIDFCQIPSSGRLDSRARTTVRRRPTSGAAHRFFPWFQ